MRPSKMRQCLKREAYGFGGLVECSDITNDGFYKILDYSGEGLLNLEKER